VQEIEKYYEGELPCKLRPNRKNAYLDNTLTQIDVQYIPHISSKAKRGNLAGRSSVTCDDNKNCLYKNVCLQQGKDMIYYGKDMPESGFYFYRNWLNEASFSWHYPLIKKNVKIPTNIPILAGRTLWMNPPYEFLHHSGHSTEVTYKLPDIRKSFPGKISYMGAAHTKKMTKWPWTQFRLSFPEEDWKVPPYFHLSQIHDNLLCFEEVLVPAHTHFGFYSHESADLYRERGLQMCGITPRKEYPPKPELVFFLERGFNRQISNGDELCSVVREKGWKVFRETLEDIEFCNTVRMVHNADIIVSNHGSQSSILPFVNPGSVILFATSKNFVITEWDTQAYYSRAHFLELYELRKDVWSLPPITDLALDAGDPLDNQYFQDIKNMGWIASHSFYYRGPTRHLNTQVHVDNFINFFDYAVSSAIFGQKKPFPCEIPLPWPHPDSAGMDPNGAPLAMWQQFAWEQQYIPCEPPEHCVCCEDSSCSELYKLQRPF